MKPKNSYKEEDILVEYAAGISTTKKMFLRKVTIKFDPSTKKGKAIGQVLDGIKRLL